MTGDGRPDFVFVGANGALSVAPIRSGMSVGTPAQLNDNVFTRHVLDARSSDVDRFAGEASLAIQHDYVWTQSIDVNGDGRLDVIDAAEQPKTWVVYLNTPDPGPSGVKWVRRTIDVSDLYQRLLEHGLGPPNDYLPLSARVTGRDFAKWVCWELQNGVYVSVPYDHCADRPSPIPAPYVGPEQTYVEYAVRDLNGDGYPDVVFNSSVVSWVPQAPPTGYQGLSVFQQQRSELRPIGSSPALYVAYNVRGLFMPSSSSSATYPFSAPEWLAASSCGVEQWTGDDVGGDRVQTLRCGLEDINGDGLLDRIEDTKLFLGTGFSFNTVQLALPIAALRKFVAMQESAYVANCTGQGAIQSNATQTVGLRDLTGDGIPDLVEPKVGGGSEVFVGTGAGFATTAIAIEGAFAFSHTDELCDGTVSNTATGLFDVNGDGKPDFVQINGGSINVYQLTGGSQPGNPESGRLVGIDNGYGATTSITYTSAKDDASTRHQVPFPEIVVNSTQTTGNQGFGGTLASTRYAYGNVSLFYDSTLDGFRSSGYQRHVALVSIPGVRSGSIQTTATISDRYPLGFVNPATLPYMSEAQRFGRYLQNGRVSDVTSLATNLSADPWSLLPVDVTTDSRRIGAVHSSIDTADTRYFADTNPPADDACKEVMFPYDYDLSVSNNFGYYSPCSARGFLYTRSTQTWRGTAAPPDTANVQVFTSVRSVDDQGRLTSVLYQNDASRSDDDVCVDTTYAKSDNTTHVLDAVAERKVWACGDKSDGRTYAHESWIYDSLFPGVVYQGLPTSHKVDRYATDTGQYLSTIQEFDASYNALGSPIGVSTTREDGANRITTIAYDEFGIAATNTSVSGTNVPTLSAAQAVDPISGQLLEKGDENGTVRGTTYDGFGRPVLRTIRRPSDSSAGVLGAINYLGFEGGDAQGRRVAVEEFTDPVDPGQVGKGLGRVSTTYLDELGRSRYEAAALGAYYSDESMITGARTYDSLGRIAFEADDHPASQAAESEREHAC